MMHPDITELARELNRNNKDLQAEIARLKTENHELIITLQQPDQVGYWQRRSELAEEKLATLRAALEEIARDGIGLADLDRERAPTHEYRDYWRAEARSRRDLARKALAEHKD